MNDSIHPRGRLVARRQSRIRRLQAYATVIVAILCAGIWPTIVVAHGDEIRTHCRVKPVHLSEVKWTDGFWQQRYITCRDKMVPSMWEIMKGTKYKPFLEHFRIAAGLSEGGYHGAKWNDGDFYK